MERWRRRRRWSGGEGGGDDEGGGAKAVAAVVFCVRARLSFQASTFIVAGVDDMWRALPRRDEKGDELAADVARVE